MHSYQVSQTLRQILLSTILATALWLPINAGAQKQLLTCTERIANMTERTKRLDLKWAKTEEKRGFDKAIRYAKESLSKGDESQCLEDAGDAIWFLVYMELK